MVYKLKHKIEWQTVISRRLCDREYKNKILLLSVSYILCSVYIMFYRHMFFNKMIIRLNQDFLSL